MDYWDEKYKDGYKAYGEGLSNDEKDYIKILIEKSKNIDKILEVGVGDGRMVKILQKHTKALFYGCDISKNVDPPCCFDIADARELPYSNDFFNMIYSLGTVEHFPETYVAITEQFRVCKSGGYVICIVPHSSINTFYRYIKMKSTGMTDENIHKINGLLG